MSGYHTAMLKQGYQDVILFVVCDFLCRIEIVGLVFQRALTHYMHIVRRPYEVPQEQAGNFRSRVQYVMPFHPIWKFDSCTQKPATLFS